MSAVGIDIDDVLFPWYDTAHQVCERAGITNGVQPTSWRPFDDYGCTDQEWFDALTEATLTGELYTGPPMGDCVEQLHRLADAGHSIHLVTARGFALENGNRTKALTVAWLDEWHVPHSSLTFSKNKALVRTHWFLDDAVHNYDQLDGHTNVWLVDRPHNLVHAPDSRRRVPSVGAFVDLVLEAAA